MEYYSAIEKKLFESVLVRWMKLEPIILIEVGKTPTWYHLLPGGEYAWREQETRDS